MFLLCSMSNQGSRHIKHLVILNHQYPTPLVFFIHLCHMLVTKNINFAIIPILELKYLPYLQKEEIEK